MQEIKKMQGRSVVFPLLAFGIPRQSRGSEQTNFFLFVTFVEMVFSFLTLLLSLSTVAPSTSAGEMRLVNEHQGLNPRIVV